MVTREQILSGIEHFVVNDVISKVQDKALQIIIDTALAIMKRRPELLDKYINNSLFKTDKGYDIDMMVEVTKSSINKLGAFPVVFPAIPFISPNEKILSFSADDIDTLANYIKGAK